MSTYIDISWPITEHMTTYKDRNDVSLQQYKQFKQDGVRETSCSASLHTGTHVDAPAHFLKDGKSMYAYALHQLCGTAYVIDCTWVRDAITAEALAEVILPRDTIVLFKTRNSYRSATMPFDYHFVYVAADAANILVSSGVRAVGIDYLGIERDQPDHATHKSLLQAHIPIIEGLRLSHVSANAYQLWCFPLAIPDAEAAPARAVLS